MISDKAFKMYDIRAIVDKDIFVEDVFDLARALATFVHNKDQNCKKVIVGMDVRTHSSAIKDQLIEGFVESGFDVVFVGECPSPALYFALYHLKETFGIMITASHNSKEYNGFKIVLNNQPVWGDEIQDIREIYQGRHFMQLHSTGFESEVKIKNDYIDYFVNQFEHLKNKNLNVAIDCGNGTAALILPRLVKKMNWSGVKLLFDHPDGEFPNHDPDPTAEKNIQLLEEECVTNSFNFGLAFDGDCDRLVVLDEKGRKLDGDKLLALLSTGINDNGTIVCDIQCSSSLKDFLAYHGKKIDMVPTGCCHIKNRMNQTNALLGGEMSGHYCFKDRYFGFDDAIYAMMRFFEIVLRDDFTTVAEELKNYTPKISSESIRIKCANIDVHELVDRIKSEMFLQKEYELLDIDGVRLEMSNSWGIVRASNTEPVLSLRFQGSTLDDLKNITKYFYTIISKYYDNPELYQKLCEF